MGQWRSQNLLCSGSLNECTCTPVKNFKPHPFPVKICISLQYDQSRCQSAKNQCASEEALAITTTRLSVVIVYVRQSIIRQGTVPTNGGA